jgi:hypothetical protein
MCRCWFTLFVQLCIHILERGLTLEAKSNPQSVKFALGDLHLVLRILYARGSLGTQVLHLTFCLPSFLGNLTISWGVLRWEKRLSLEARIFNTWGTFFHLLANTWKENTEIFAFLEVGEEWENYLWTPWFSRLIVPSTCWQIPQIMGWSKDRHSSFKDCCLFIRITSK